MLLLLTCNKGKKDGAEMGCVCVCVCVLSHFSCVQFCPIILWTVAHQAPLSMGFYRQEYWSGSPCPPPGDLPDPGMEPASLMSPALAGRFFTTNTSWEAQISYMYTYIWASSVAQTVKNLPERQETRIQSLGGEDPLETEMATHSSILACRIPWTEELGGLQSMGSQREIRLSDLA